MMGLSVSSRAICILCGNLSCEKSIYAREVARFVFLVVIYLAKKVFAREIARMIFLVVRSQIILRATREKCSCARFVIFAKIYLAEKSVYVRNWKYVRYQKVALDQYFFTVINLAKKVFMREVARFVFFSGT